MAASLSIVAVLSLGAVVGATSRAASATTRSAVVSAPAGYWLAAADGGVFSYHVPFFGNPEVAGSNICMAPTTVNPWVCRGIAATETGDGYWVVSSETFEGGISGRVSGFGDAPFPNAPPPLAGLNAELVGVATTIDSGHNGGGIWLAGADGGVFAYGDAPFDGSMAGRPLALPVVGIVSDPVASGYWLVAADGGVFAFGAAGFHGSMAAGAQGQRVVGMAPTPDGQGYWLATSDGNVVPFGDAAYLGSLAGQPYLGQIRLNAPIVGIASTGDGHGYWLVAADGGVFCFGDAPFLGSAGGLALRAPVVGMTVASLPAG
jgi:hypothetical protein